MNGKRPAGICAYCARETHILQGRIDLCVIHYRISSMRARASRDGKSVPTRLEIEGMVPEPLACPVCARVMNWLRKDGASTQATLQHDRDGTVRIICSGCNSRHAQHPGDLFYSIPAGSKYCHDCDRVLPLEAFHRDNHLPIGRSSYCKSCVAVRDRKRNARRAA